jgi:hypothetical protein
MMCPQYHLSHFLQTVKPSSIWVVRNMISKNLNLKLNNTKVILVILLLVRTSPLLYEFGFSVAIDTILVRHNL